MRSLRTRLSNRTTAVLLSTSFIAAAVLYLLMQASLYREFDSALLLEARSLATHFEQSAGGVQIEPEIAALPEYSTAEHLHFFQVRTAAGDSPVRSPSLSGFDLQSPSIPTLQPAHQSTILPNGKRGRSVALSIQPRLEEDDEEPARQAERPHVTLVVARDTSNLDATLTRLAALLILVTLVAAVVCIPLTGAVVRHELMPLGNLAHSIEQISAADLSTRISVADCPCELVPVVDCLNQLLGRLGQALLRERSITADVAHELRTPLAGLETSLEVCASRPREANAYHTVVANCLEITRGMHSMVDSLLNLARADADQIPLKLESTDVCSLVRESWLPFAEGAQGRDLQVEWSLDGAPRIFIDYESFGRIFANLFDNAVTYAEPGGTIRISVNDQGGQVAITIANNGCLLHGDDVSRVFDRFWRADASRTATGLHCGLGLSLCKKLVELHRGSMTAEVRDGWFFATVTMPITKST